MAVARSRVTNSITFLIRRSQVSVARGPWHVDALERLSGCRASCAWQRGISVDVIHGTVCSSHSRPYPQRVLRLGAKEFVLMRAKLFVGNLSWNVDDAQLEELFREYGEIESARVITDRDTGRSRGFGFVELDVPDVNVVINALNGREVDGRPIRVNE